MNTTTSLIIDRLTDTTATLRLVSDPTRFRILCLLRDAKDAWCVGEIAKAVEVSQSAISHQLSKLEARGVVVGTRVGQTVCYRLDTTPCAERVVRTLNIFTPRGV